MYNDPNETNNLFEYLDGVEHNPTASQQDSAPNTNAKSQDAPDWGVSTPKEPSYSAPSSQTGSGWGQESTGWITGTPNAYGGQIPPTGRSTGWYGASESPKAPRPKKAKTPKEKKPPRPMSMRAAAVMMAVGITASAAAGFGGGYLSGTLNAPAAPAPEKSSAPASAVSANTTGLSVAQIAEKVEDSVVEITTESVTNGGFFMEQYISSGAGSGVIVSEDGYIITNNHVIENANTIKVRLKNGESYDAKLIGTDSQTDVAVIKIEATGLGAVTMGDSSALKVGQVAVAVGNPLGRLGGTVTDGIVSALDREITLDGKTMNLLQTNAAINPGNSGGGLFNDQGELIGLVVAKSSGENVEGLGFAIPVNDVKTVMENLIDYGYVRGRFTLGVTTVDITSAESQMKYGVEKQGVYIQQVNVGGNAETAGIQVGDRVVSVDGTAIESGSQLKEIIQSHTAGDRMTMVVERQNQQITLAVVLNEATQG